MMKYLRKFAGIIFLFVVVFMITSMFRYQAEQNREVVLENVAAGEDNAIEIGMSGGNLAGIAFC